MVLAVKNPPANAGDIRDAGSIPGFGRSLREGKGYPLQYSSLENSMDRIVHEVEKSQTRLSDFNFPSQRPNEGNGNPLDYSSLENSVDRGAWQATVHGITKSWT